MMQQGSGGGGYGFFGSNQKPGNQVFGGNQGMMQGMMGQGFGQRVGGTALPDYQSPNFQSNIQVLAQAAGKIGRINLHSEC